ncbi:MAG: hypothetical protein GC150_00060 [Rhizobiales bacterium]|nr:hypothetical protein [Hyphomicrobiales bacterium]
MILRTMVQWRDARLALGHFVLLAGLVVFARPVVASGIISGACGFVPAHTLQFDPLQPMRGELSGWGLGQTASVGAGGVLSILLPEGSINPGNRQAPRGGIGLRWRPGGLAGARRACLSYQLHLPHDFEFALGGKLPGFIGGDAPTGGRAAELGRGFSLRLMWRRGGRGEIYAYVPGHPVGRGASIARGAWRFPRGRWVAVSEEVRLERPGQRDGLVRVLIDGVEVVRREGLVIAGEGVGIDGVAIDVFYGGKSREWAAPRDTRVLLSEIRIDLPATGEESAE